MCDIFITECKLCGREIDVHVADFCVPRDTISAFCLPCLREKGTADDMQPALATGQMFFDRNVLFVVAGTDKKAYGICKNGRLPRRRMAREGGA
jgi:hypothetical protein